MGESKAGLENDPEFKRLAALRSRLSSRYSLLVLGLFTLFMITSALFRDAMGTPVIAGSPFTVGLVATFLMVVLPIALAVIFLRKTNRDIEPLRTKLADRRKAERQEQ